MRPEKKFSHKIPLLHTLCNITRNGDNIYKTYLDIQSETDGINVPNINKWNNNSYGFTFHCWLRLDKFQESHVSYGKQRQLLKYSKNFYSYLLHISNVLTNFKIFIIVC